MNSKVHLISATKKCPSRFFIKNNGRDEFQINYSTYRDLAHQTQQYFEELRRRQTKPVIVFTRIDSKEMKNYWSPEVFCKYNKIDNNEVAEKVRQTELNKKIGIFVLDKKFQRGYEMKLAIDAYTMYMQWMMDSGWVKWDKWSAETVVHSAKVKEAITPTSLAKKLKTSSNIWRLRKLMWQLHWVAWLCLRALPNLEVCWCCQSKKRAVKWRLKVQHLDFPR